MLSLAGSVKLQHNLRSAPEHIWVLMLLRALPAAIGALVITFTQDHNPRFAFTVIGATILLSAVVVVWLSVCLSGYPARAFIAAQGGLGLIAGAFWLVITFLVPAWANAGNLILSVACWAIIAGVLDLLVWFIARKNELYANDCLISGGLAVLLGIIVAQIPPDLYVEYGGRDNVQGSLTADVQAVGFVGAFFAITGVFLIVEAISLRFALGKKASDDTASMLVDSAGKTGANA